jgi:hypothetical protein
MPGPAVHAVENLLFEILSPARSDRGTVICDCCRRARSVSDFDEDGCGICCRCLESDALLVELNAIIRGRRAVSGLRGFQGWKRVSQ